MAPAGLMPLPADSHGACNARRRDCSSVDNWRPMPGKCRNWIGGLINGNDSRVGRPRAVTEKTPHRIRNGNRPRPGVPLIPASRIRPAACSTARGATTCVASRRVAAAYGVAHLALRTPFYVQNHDARRRYARGNIGAQGKCLLYQGPHHRNPPEGDFHIRSYAGTSAQ